MQFYGSNNKDPASSPLTGLAAVAAMITGGAIGAVAIVFALVVLRCWVISRLWDWYMVPGFHLQPIGLALAFGVSVMFAFLAPVHTDDNKEGFMRGVSRMLGALVAGWVGSFFM